LESVTVSVIVLLAVPKLKLHDEEFEQICVPLLFHTQVVTVEPLLSAVELPSKVTVIRKGRLEPRRGAQDRPFIHLYSGDG
jgi:hypothetical protein